MKVLTILTYFQPHETGLAGHRRQMLSMKKQYNFGIQGQSCKQDAVNVLWETL